MPTLPYLASSGNCFPSLLMVSKSLPHFLLLKSTKRPCFLFPSLLPLGSCHWFFCTATPLHSLLWASEHTCSGEDNSNDVNLLFIVCFGGVGGGGFLLFLFWEFLCVALAVIVIFKKPERCYTEWQKMLVIENIRLAKLCKFLCPLELS